MPDFPLAAQKVAIQDIRSNFAVVGIDISHITDAEIIAIRQYTTRAYVPLKSGLRSGGSQAELAKSGSIIQQVVGRPPPKMGDIDVFGRTLLSGLNKLTSYKGRVYRGEGMNRIGEFIKMKPGDTWVEPAPLNTSYDPTAAFKKPVKFEIDVDSGVQIDGLSTIASEFEVLMKPGARFQFISLIKDPSTGGFIIRAKEIKYGD